MNAYIATEPRWHTRPRKSPKFAALASCVLLILGPIIVINGHPTVGRTLSSFPKFPVRPSYVPALSPIAVAALGLSPKSTIAVLGKPSKAIRAIEVLPRQLELISGGRTIRTIATASGTTSLQKVTAEANRASWISEKKPGTFVVSAALIFGPGTTVSISAPSVKRIQLVDKPEVFIGLNGSSVDFQGVAVSAVNVPAFKGDEPPYRPFVVAVHNSTLNVTSSSFAGLGYDWNASYGVSWISSTGRAIDSKFSSGFIGAYTEESQGITFKGDLFTHNLLYGLDPNKFSSDLVVTKNRAFDNGRNGIFLSNYVTESAVSYNVANSNGENGIVMNAHSNNDVIDHNTIIGNAADGVVLSSSIREKVYDNLIKHNRVGINVYGSSSVGDGIKGNNIQSNVAAFEGAALTLKNTTVNNGTRHRWLWLLDLPILGLVVILLLASFCFSMSERRRRKKYEAVSINVSLATASS